MLFLATEAPQIPARDVLVATGAAEYAWLLPVLALVGALLTLAFGRRLGEPGAAILPTALSGVTFVGSIGVFSAVANADGPMVHEVSRWLDVGGLTVPLTTYVDELTAVMLIVVTGVATLVHIYSIGYMHGDENYARYFGYLNLFLASMLILVLGGSFLVLFVGWELVGLSSYLLIGFWFTKPEYATAAKKAFITNRVGDVSFMVAMFVIATTFGTLAFGDVLPAASNLSSNQALIIGLLLLGGAVAKSAQIPLYVWLPDAMAGPTPVSALMHAATMVTAGVYLIARSSAIWVESATLLTVTTWIGAATALMAALIACKQDDLKKILAYSTVSQLGYMVMAAGAGGFTEGIFHLFTHAFFKGLLFLAAGSVMHALANETNIWKMGGLREIMPITWATAAVGWLAITGLPPFSGFFSKDQALTIVYEHGFTGAWVVGIITAALTGYYMTRWYGLIFLGPRRWSDDKHPHESPSSMTTPLVILAVPAALAGIVLGWGHTTSRFTNFLQPAVSLPSSDVLSPHGPLTETWLIIISIIVAAIGVTAGWRSFVTPDIVDAERSDKIGGRVGTLLQRKFLVDEVYAFVFVRVGRVVAAMAAWVDAHIVDALVRGAARLAQTSGDLLRRLQTGSASTYLATVLVGTIVVVGLAVMGIR